MQGHHQPRSTNGPPTPRQSTVRYTPTVLKIVAMLTRHRYGVSRVYNQQCGYTLLDTQAMHDKMVTQLKIIQGTGLDPTAGQAK